MVEQLVARQREMAQRHEATATATYRQATMTQYAEEEEEALPQGWIRMWDNPGKKHYYFNTIDHDIQYDRVKVLEIVALASQDTSSPGQDTTVRPDGVVSSYNTITPSPNLDRKLPPLSYGGFVEIASSDDNEVVVTPKKRKKSPKKPTPPKANLSRPSREVPKRMVPKNSMSESDDDNEFDSETFEHAQSEDLPQTEDFCATYDVQEEENKEENNDYYEKENGDDENKNGNY
jgi:hypothetical protein